MSPNKSPAHQTSVDRFWDNYLFILKKNAIPKNSIPWYRKHAEAYIKANKNTPLSRSNWTGYRLLSKCKRQTARTKRVAVSSDCRCNTAFIY